MSENTKPGRVQICTHTGVNLDDALLRFGREYMRNEFRGSPCSHLRFTIDGTCEVSLALLQ